MDELSRELSLPAGELVRTLTLLEMKKVVRKMPGNTFARR
jgi:DNA processing protein